MFLSSKNIINFAPPEIRPSGMERNAFFIKKICAAFAAYPLNKGKTNEPIKPGRRRIQGCGASDRQDTSWKGSIVMVPEMTFTCRTPFWLQPMDFVDFMG